MGAVSHLPFEPHRLIEILAETEPGPANDPQDPDHIVFWLVVADQFAKRGIVCERVREKSLALLDGEKPAEFAIRSKVLEEVRARILATQSKPRKVLKNPQPLVMQLGDVVVYPTCRGKCINPYAPSRDRDLQYMPEGPKPWWQDSWSALVVVDCDRAFGFLAWYRPVVLAFAPAEKPSLESLLPDSTVWMLETPGTCSPNHYRKMAMEKIGNLPVQREKLLQLIPNLRPGISAAVSDISIANRLHSSRSPSVLARLGEQRKGRTRVIEGIGRLL